MNTPARDYPAGSVRVSDADRDQALSELSEAFQAGRITAAELDQRSGQALRARTAEELTALLADLPHDRPAATPAQARPAHRVIAARVTMGASAVTAATLCAVCVSSALSYAPKTLQQREFAQHLAQQVLARQGISVPVPLPANPGFDWAGTITPAVIALLLIGLIIVLRARRADRF
jgi:cytochrome c5